jgi:hypothetical protein
MEAVAFFKMDIFFIVTTTVVVLFGIFGAVILYYIVKIVQSIHSIMLTVQKEADVIAKDFEEVRKEVKEGVQDVRMGITTATNYTKMVAGAGIVKALSGLFEAVVEEKTRKKKKEKEKKKKTE